MSSGVVPSVMEVMGRYLIQAINENTELNLPDVDTMLLVETDGYTQGEADAQMERIIEIFKANKATEVTLAKTVQERADLWAARKSTYPVSARLNNSTIVEDVTVPMSRLADLFRGVRQGHRQVRSQGGHVRPRRRRQLPPPDHL